MKRNNKNSRKNGLMVLALALILVMAMPLTAFADDTGTPSGDIPTFVTVEKTSDMSILDLTIGNEIALTTNGTTLGSGTLEIANTRTAGAVLLTKAVYTPNNGVTGWELVKADSEIEGMAINARKYTLSLKYGTENLGDLYSAVTVSGSTVTILPEDSVTLSFSGKAAASSSKWTRIPMGKLVLTFKLYQDTEVFQIRMDESSTVTGKSSLNTLYATEGQEVYMILSNSGTGTITGMTVKNTETDATVSVQEVTQGTKYKFTMPAAPVLVTPTVS